MNQNKDSSHLFVAIVLILIGTLFLLQNFQIIDASLWEHLWKLWPLGFIFWGLQSLSNSARNIKHLAYLFLFSFFGLLAITSLNLPSFSLTPQFKKATILKKDLTISHSDYLTDDVEKRVLHLDVGLGQFEMEDSNREDYFKVKAEYDTRTQPELVSDFKDETLDIFLKAPQKDRLAFNSKLDYQAELGMAEIPTDINLDVGLGKAEIDLDQTIISGMDINVGVGSAIVGLDEEASASGSFVFDVGVGNLEVTLPADVGYSLSYDVGLGNLTVNNSNLSGSGRYESDNYNSSQETIDIQASVGVGSINITSR